MKNTHLLLVAFVSLFAFTGCAKIDDLNLEGITDSESTTPLVDDATNESTPDCNCGVVLDSWVHDDGVTVFTKVENHCSGRIVVFGSCPDDMNPEIFEVGSEFCRENDWS